MLLARADRFHGGLLGVCLFHRTWANNVFVDFLAVHPDTMKPDNPITGVGLSSAGAQGVDRGPGGSEVFGPIIGIMFVPDDERGTRGHKPGTCNGSESKAWDSL